jgi:hypothetical protein
MATVLVKDPCSALEHELRTAGYAVLEPAVAREALELDAAGLDGLRESWERLPRDPYLRDGGHYRARRHSSFIYGPAARELTAVAQRPHWQPTTYNALHGGMLRWFEPIEPAVAANASFRQLLASLGELFARVQRVSRWYLEAHQFRIDTEGGIGRSAPRWGRFRGGGAHRAARRARRGDAGVRGAGEPWSALHHDTALVDAAHGRCTRDP